MKNLIVVAHPDDEILGVGATGNALVQSGDEVCALIMCGSVSERNLRPNDIELHSDIIKANNLLGFNKPVIGDFANIKMNIVPVYTILQTWYNI